MRMHRPTRINYDRYEVGETGPLHKQVEICPKCGKKGERYDALGMDCIAHDLRINYNTRLCEMNCRCILDAPPTSPEAGGATNE
jgi:hypothetical protein